MNRNYKDAAYTCSNNNGLSIDPSTVVWNSSSFWWATALFFAEEKSSPTWNDISEKELPLWLQFSYPTKERKEKTKLWSDTCHKPKNKFDSVLTVCVSKTSTEINHNNIAKLKCWYTFN